MKPRPPLHGYNHNLRYAGRTYHVQTEDSGIQNPHVYTHLFHGGTILATKRLEYDPQFDVAQVQKLMQEQHKAMLRDLRAGHFDPKIEMFFGEPVVRGSLEPADSQRKTDPFGQIEKALEGGIPLSRVGVASESSGRRTPIDGAPLLPDVTFDEQEPRRAPNITRPEFQPIASSKPVAPGPERPVPVPVPLPVDPSQQYVAAGRRPTPRAVQPPVRNPTSTGIPPRGAPGSPDAAPPDPDVVRNPPTTRVAVVPPGPPPPQRPPLRPMAPPSRDVDRPVPERRTMTYSVQPSAEGVVVARPAVIVGERGQQRGSSPPTKRGNTPLPTLLKPVRDRAPVIENIFGENPVTETNLDEAILAYLSEDIDK